MILRLFQTPGVGNFSRPLTNNVHRNQRPLLACITSRACRLLSANQSSLVMDALKRIWNEQNSNSTAGHFRLSDECRQVALLWCALQDWTSGSLRFGFRFRRWKTAPGRGIVWVPARVFKNGQILFGHEISYSRRVSVGIRSENVNWLSAPGMWTLFLRGYLWGRIEYLG